MYELDNSVVLLYGQTLQTCFLFCSLVVMLLCYDFTFSFDFMIIRIALAVPGKECTAMTGFTSCLFDKEK